jgi:hypothetical protein
VVFGGIIFDLPNLQNKYIVFPKVMERLERVDMYYWKIVLLLECRLILAVWGGTLNNCFQLVKRFHPKMQKKL